MLRDMTNILRGLTVDEARVRGNIDLTGGLVYSQRVLTFLLDELNLSREAAYAVVQENAMRTARGEGRFPDLLLRDGRIQGLVEPERLEALFENGFYLRHVDAIFDRFAKD